MYIKAAVATFQLFSHPSRLLLVVKRCYVFPRARLLFVFLFKPNTPPQPPSGWRSGILNTRRAAQREFGITSKQTSTAGTVTSDVIGKLLYDELTKGRETKEGGIFNKEMLVVFFYLQSHACYFGTDQIQLCSSAYWKRRRRRQRQQSVSAKCITTPYTHVRSR